MLLRPLFAKVGSVRRCLDAMVLLTELARQGGITTMAEMLQGAFSLPYEQRLFDQFEVKSLNFLDVAHRLLG